MHPRQNGHQAPPTTAPQGRGGGARAIAALTTVLVGVAFFLTACSSSSGNAGPADGRSPSTTTTTTLPAAEVTATVADGATDVPITKPIGVTVEHGTIESIELTRGPDATFAPEPGDGVLNAEATGWLSPSDFAPGSPYRIEATVQGADGATVDHSWNFTTGAAVTEIHTSINVGDNYTYGVGMPLIVTLNTPVAPEHHKAVAERLKVTSDPAVTGGWRWFSDTEVHYRPVEFWPANTAVHLDVDLAGLHLGDGIWGVDGRTVDFAIGNSHITTVDAASHRMTVNVNGEEVKNLPMSAGKDEHPTRNGIHVVNEKHSNVIMDSTTVGIPEDSPDSYYLDVDWAVRISNSGEFVHSAPWSVASQGNANVSHGCINLAPADAKWFFDMTQTGDVVIVVNTPNALEPWNGYGDWQIPWDDWVN